jgi:hypothetical protein
MIKINPNEETVLKFQNEISGTVKIPKVRLVLPINENESYIINSNEVENKVAKIKVNNIGEIFKDVDIIKEAYVELLFDNEKNINETIRIVTWKDDVKLERPFKVNTVFENVERVEKDDEEDFKIKANSNCVVEEVKVEEVKKKEKIIEEVKEEVVEEEKIDEEGINKIRNSLDELFL